MGKPHGCSGPCCCWCLCVCQLWRMDTQAAQSGVLQAERAVELHRPRARPLTLCLLRMKREDFITSCRPRLHPSCLPPPKPHFPSYPLLLPSLHRPASLPHSQPVACFRACPSQKRGSRLPKKTSHPMAGLVLCTERKGEENEGTERWHIWFESIN